MNDDEHIAHLQRLAYGADASGPDRARASAELAELAAAAGTDRGPSPRAGGRAATAQDPGSTVGIARDPGDPVHDAAARARIRRRVALVGCAGLLAGWAIGAALVRGATAGPDPPSAGIAPTGPAFGSGERAIPLEGTDLAGVFDRLPPVADVSPLVDAVAGIDPASVRLLATRADGLAAFIARTADGADVCLILLDEPDGFAQPECTTGGMMPAGGLHVRHVSARHGSALAILSASGAIAIGPGVGR